MLRGDTAVGIAIVLTADVQMAQKQAYLSHGFDECLLKPVSLGQFRQLLIRWGVLREEEGVVAEPPAVETAASASTNGPAVLDMAAMEKQLGALDDGTIGMLGAFIRMTRPDMEKIAAAFARNDQLRVKEIAHSLKGAARSACCMELGQVAAEIQDLGDKGLPVTPEMMSALEASFARAEEAIAALRPV